jgi:predicted nucleotidyltransferase
MLAIDPQIRSYLDRVVSTLRDHLGTDLVGVYLHGSLAMGVFHPGRSDLDVLSVCAQSLSGERRLELGQALFSIPRSVGDLEFSLVTETTARSGSSVPPFEVHVSHEEPFVLDGSDRDGDPDLVVHFAMARARGRALIGPEPDQMFPEPARTALIRAFISDIHWARESGEAGWESHSKPELASMAYRVLNAARSWRYVESGDLGSKVEGAAWLKRRHSDPRIRALLDAAVAYQQGAEPDLPDQRMVDAFVDRVEDRLRRATPDAPRV